MQHHHECIQLVGKQGASLRPNPTCGEKPKLMDGLRPQAGSSHDILRTPSELSQEPSAALRCSPLLPPGELNSGRGTMSRGMGPRAVAAGDRGSPAGVTEAGLPGLRASGGPATAAATAASDGSCCVFSGAADAGAVGGTGGRGDTPAARLPDGALLPRVKDLGWGVEGACHHSNFEPCFYRATRTSWCMAYL